MRAYRWVSVFAAGLAFLALYPAFAGSYDLTVMRDALIFAMFAVGLDLFWGRTGILCFGHAAFFGVGGYAMALVTLSPDMPAPAVLGLLAAVALPALLAAIVGYFLFYGGVRGSYFTIVTLALSVIAQQVVIAWSSVTGGDTGLLGIPPLAFGSFDLSGDLASYGLVAVLLALLLAGLRLLTRGRWGQVLKAIGDNEVRAAALGHDAPARLTVAFVLSAAIAGFAGALYVSASGVVAPDMIGLALSTEAVAWVVIGGRGTLIGPVIGAVLVQRAQQEISSFNPVIWPMIIGLMFVAVAFLQSEAVERFAKRLASRKSEVAP
ncbi:UNVERIFIED_ORG: branched-chain amino acid ABC transporter permease (plasmid) [Roseateles sp. XES5]|nr:branched-chain amino acid ABC transporter permease [Roseateles sp. XES5]